MRQEGRRSYNRVRQGGRGGYNRVRQGKRKKNGRSFENIKDYEVFSRKCGLAYVEKFSENR